jgi:drug/metabolite transporter (DMT)-like permease
MEGWVWWTLLAACMQSVRTAGQKHLSGNISAIAATMVRYLFGLPFALAYLAAVIHYRDTPVPELNRTFLVAALLAGLLQIVATVLLVRLFTLRNFAVGSTYVRTEVVLTAIIGFLFFTEDISVPGWIAIVVCVSGVVLINLARTGGIDRIWNRSAAYGLGAGLAFALTSLLIRRASLSFGIDDSLLTASMTLCYMVTWQTLVTVSWILLTDRSQFAGVFRMWRPSTFVGLTSVVGSAGWFTAMTLESASYVKTLGQVEFLITLGIGWFYFRERPSRVELLGMLLIVSAVVGLLTAG